MCIEHQESNLASTKCNVKTSSYLTIRMFMLPIARSNDTQWLSDKSCWHWLPPILKAQCATRWKPHLWPKSSQLSTLVPKVSLGGKEKQQCHHVSCTTDVWTCRGPPAQDLRYRFALSCKSKCQTWHPMQQSMVLGHWMRPNANATWQSQWCDCHNNCDVLTQAQDYCPIATEYIATSNYKLIGTQ